VAKNYFCRQKTIFATPARFFPPTGKNLPTLIPKIFILIIFLEDAEGMTRNCLKEGSGWILDLHFYNRIVDK